MINIVFEGSTGSGKTTLIRKLKEYYENEYKVGITNDIDDSSPLYEVIKKMFEESALVSLNGGFNTLRYETLIQAADYLYLREKIYSENNQINLLDRNYSSIYSYQSVLVDGNIDNSDEFMNNVLLCMKSGEKPVDLMIFFDIDLATTMERSENRDKRNFTQEEKRTFEKFNDKLKKYIIDNSCNYEMLIIDKNYNEEQTFELVKNRIDNLLKEKRIYCSEKNNLMGKQKMKHL